MSWRIELSNEEYETLKYIMHIKAKELWAWKAALSSGARDREYSQVLNVLSALKRAQEVE